MSIEAYEFVDDSVRKLVEMVKSPEFDGGCFTCSEADAVVELLRSWASTSGAREAVLMAADLVEISHADSDTDPDDRHITGDREHFAGEMEHAHG